MILGFENPKNSLTFAANFNLNIDFYESIRNCFHLESRFI